MLTMNRKMKHLKFSSMEEKKEYTDFDFITKIIFSIS